MMRYVQAVLSSFINFLEDAGASSWSWMRKKWDSRPKGFENIPMWLLGFVFFGSAVSGLYWLKGAERVFMPLADYTNTHHFTSQLLIVWGFVGLFAFQGVFFKGLAWHTGRIFWKRMWG
ncbi:hypothetical protein [Paraburkholderia tropica]|uniref:hypothetical protein n=1 Tax=Paraburkholderia tropica TaxID=92647 RepID=UPI003D28CEFE